MFTNPLILTIIFFLILKTGFVFFLEWIRQKQLKEIATEETQKKERWDAETKEPFDEGKLRAAQYQLSKSRFTVFSELYRFTFLFLLIPSQILPQALTLLPLPVEASFLSDALVLLSLLIAVEVVFTPLGLYHTFILETRFGFNTMTFKLFLLDTFKKTVIGIAIFFLLFTPIFFLNKAFPNSWWFVAACICFCLSIGMQIVFPRFIYPLFNKLTPLEDGELKTSLKQLFKITQFSAEKVFISDSSRRSLHQNAFFTGLGKARMIVLFDTLVSSLNTHELKAVLAHEIGHYKKGHIKKNIATSLVIMFLGFFILHLISSSALLHAGFGFTEKTFVASLVIFSLYSNVLSFWIRPLTNIQSCKYEFEADAYAKQQMGNGKSLLTALTKLHSKNLSLSTENALYKKFYYSHPTLKERTSALEENHG